MIAGPCFFFLLGVGLGLGYIYNGFNSPPVVALPGILGGTYVPKGLPGSSSLERDSNVTVDHAHKDAPAVRQAAAKLELFRTIRHRRPKAVAR